MSKLSISFSALFLGLVVFIGQPLAADETDVIEEVIVTADKRGTELQDVPFAVSAFSGDDLSDRLINDAMALQFNVPNMITSKYNFSGGGSVRLRGIGSGAVGSAGDGGVGIHINGSYLNASRLFETQYYDVQAVEVARGPQGTLYGRNTTGGAVNMVTAKADLEQNSGGVKLLTGNYGTTELQGHLNLTISDDLAVRFAGYSQKRDGYVKNTFGQINNDIDNRDLNSTRFSLTWTPSADTTVNLMWQNFKEDDQRVRSQKQACVRDPSGVLGCLPTGDLVYGVANNGATITGELVKTISDVLNGGYGLLATLGFPVAPPGPFPADDYVKSVNPQDPRKVHMDWDPVYRAEESIFTLNVTHEVDNMTFTSRTGIHDPSVYSEEDYEKSVASENWAPQLAAIAALSQLPALGYWAVPNVVKMADYLTSLGAGALAPFFVELAPGLGYGLWAGNPGLAQFAQGVPLLMPDGSINRYNHSIGYDQSTSNPKQFTQEFTLASNFDGDMNFLLGGFYLDYETETHYVVRNTPLTLIGMILPANPALFPAPAGDPHNPQDEANPYMQGYDNDTRKYELESWAVFGELYIDVSEEVTATIGLRYSDEEKNGKQRTCYVTFLECGPLDAEKLNGYYFPQYSDTKLSWKANLAYDANPDTMVYGTISSSYKSGGFNPISDSDPLVISDPSNASFEPETVIALEAGFKSTLRDEAIQVNGTVFYYDYENMQTSKIVDVTSLNKNTDATIYGAELDVNWRPAENLQITVVASILDTEIKNFKDYDSADPNGNGSTSGLISCNSNLVLASSPNGCGAGRIPGVLKNLDGNELPQSPSYSINIGAAYFVPVGPYGLRLATNFYQQDAMYVRNFNSPQDRVGSWKVWNASATIAPSNGQYFAEFWIKNISDDDYVVSQYLSTQVSGLFRNQFRLDPRTYGISIGFNW